MALENWVRRGHPILLAVIIFFSIIEGALATWLTVRYNQHHNWSSIAERNDARFLTFTSWWTVIVSFFIGALFWHNASGSVLTSVLAHVVVLGLTWIFWTAGAAAITAAIGGGYNCSRIDFQVTYCNQLNALMGFGWTVWLFVTVALFIVIVRGISGARRGDGFRGPLVSSY